MLIEFRVYVNFLGVIPFACALILAILYSTYTSTGYFGSTNKSDGCAVGRLVVCSGVGADANALNCDAYALRCYCYYYLLAYTTLSLSRRECNQRTVTI